MLEVEIISTTSIESVDAGGVSERLVKVQVIKLELKVCRYY